MEKLIVLNADDKQNGSNYKCLCPQLKLAPHSQVAVVAASIDTDLGFGNDMFLINIPNLPIASVNATPHKFGFLQTVRAVALPIQDDGAGGTMDGAFQAAFNPPVYVNLDNQEEINLTELNVLITDNKGQQIETNSNETCIVLKFRVDPHFQQMSLMREQANLLEKMMLAKREQADIMIQDI